MHLARGQPILASLATRTVALGDRVEALDKWFNDATSTPAGAILLMVLVYVTRIALDQWTQRRARTKARKRKHA